MPLTAGQIEQYQREGYVCPVPVMPAAEALRLRGQLEAVEASQGGALHAPQRSRAFLLFKWLDALIRDPRVLDPIEQLIGPDILCWSTIFWIKDAGSRSFVSWHQDNTYWGLSSREVATAWFAISDASVEAGCMSVLPGSHQGRTLEHEDTYHEDNMLTRGQAIKAIDESRAVSMPLRAGEMSIHNYCLAHGSGPNLSEDRRIGVSMHFMPPQTRQVVGSWDCAALVRGEDRYSHFVPTPVPVRDFDPVAVAFHAQAAKAMREVVYAGAEKKPARL
ncbi:MAG: phytanoyl-CoA dioxygenase family protein [Proteobacteria bacterium]|nr:phytanoyl-CoA dioxygenase family protein [Pseudomonadota bacterium]MDA0983400.1 phytanoyl-CoA dioxygenase family protein [Pseudomonadota bacterium]